MQDEGTFKATTLDVSADGRYLATGSYSGTVNVYDGLDFDDIARPIKTLDQLTTAINLVRFSPDGTKLLFASKWKRNGVRVADIPSCQVFNNFPGSDNHMKMVFSGAFSKDYLAIGNDEGVGFLYRLGHVQ